MLNFLFIKDWYAKTIALIYTKKNEKATVTAAAQPWKNEQVIKYYYSISGNLLCDSGDKSSLQKLLNRTELD